MRWYYHDPKTPRVHLLQRVKIKWRGLLRRGKFIRPTIIYYKYLKIKKYIEVQEKVQVANKNNYVKTNCMHAHAQLHAQHDLALRANFTSTDPIHTPTPMTTPTFNPSHAHGNPTVHLLSPHLYVHVMSHLYQPYQYISTIRHIHSWAHTSTYARPCPHASSLISITTSSTNATNPYACLHLANTHAVLPYVRPSLPYNPCLPTHPWRKTFSLFVWTLLILS